MSFLRFIPELPLLRRELIELSNRPRTYVVRFFGAVVILTIVLIAFSRHVSQYSAGNPATVAGARWSPVQFNGVGGEVFKEIVPLLFHAVQLLMPALICGAITIEKERNTLGTLFVTRLSPMTIVFEKLCSRLVPMLTVLLLTFPVLAFLYSLGGVDTRLLFSSLWLLLCECIFYASIGLLCSSWFATTTAAFVWSYVLTGLLMLAATIVNAHSAVGMLTPWLIWVSEFGWESGFYSGQTEWMTDRLANLINRVLPQGLGDSFYFFFRIVVTSLPSLMVAGMLIVLARIFLIRRAFVSSASMLLPLFRKVDTLFTRLNNRMTGGVVLVRDHDAMPMFDPVAWRERDKKSLGKARYLFRILVVLEGPVLFICLMFATISPTTDYSGLRSLLLLIWGISSMMLMMKASTAISSERTRETLEALLSTPMTAREILSQKIVGMRRLMLVLSIPILSIHLTLLLMHFDPIAILQRGTLSSMLAILLYGVMVAGTTITVMHLAAWLSLLLGLRQTSQSRSFMNAATVIGFWVAVSVFLFTPSGPGYGAIAAAIGVSPETSVRYSGPGRESKSEFDDLLRAFVSTVACMARPDGSIQANEAILVAFTNVPVKDDEVFYAVSRSRGMAMFAAMLVLAFQIFLVRIVRFWTLRTAPRLLGRLEESNPQLTGNLKMTVAGEMIAKVAQ